jgi:hypothetical protein
MTESELETLFAMEREGGGFVRRLALAWLFADQENFEKLRAAFPEYWAKYAAVGRSRRNHSPRQRSVTELDESIGTESHRRDAGATKNRPVLRGVVSTGRRIT